MDTGILEVKGWRIFFTLYKQCLFSFLWPVALLHLGWGLPLPSEPSRKEAGEGQDAFCKGDGPASTSKVCSHAGLGRKVWAFVEMSMHWNLPSHIAGRLEHSLNSSPHPSESPKSAHTQSVTFGSNPCPPQPPRDPSLASCPGFLLQDSAGGRQLSPPLRSSPSFFAQKPHQDQHCPAELSSTVWWGHQLFFLLLVYLF